MSRNYSWYVHKLNLFAFALPFKLHAFGVSGWELGHMSDLPFLSRGEESPGFLSQKLTSVSHLWCWAKISCWNALPQNVSILTVGVHPESHCAEVLISAALWSFPDVPGGPLLPLLFLNFSDYSLWVTCHVLFCLQNKHQGIQPFFSCPLNPVCSLISRNVHY